MRPCSGLLTDIPGAKLSSGGEVFAVRPGGFLVVEGAGFEASVLDADEPVGDSAERVVVPDFLGAEAVVVGAGAGGGVDRAARLGGEGVQQPVIAGVPGSYGLL